LDPCQLLAFARDHVSEVQVRALGDPMLPASPMLRIGCDD